MPTTNILWFSRMLDSSEDVHVFGVSQAREQLGLPKLSLKQRVIGFAICIGIAAVFALLVSPLDFSAVHDCLLHVHVQGSRPIDQAYIHTRHVMQLHGCFCVGQIDHRSAKQASVSQQCRMELLCG